MSEKTVSEIIDTLTEQQRTALYGAIGCILCNIACVGRYREFKKMLKDLNDEQQMVANYLIKEARIEAAERKD